MSELSKHIATEVSNIPKEEGYATVIKSEVECQCRCRCYESQSVRDGHEVGHRVSMSVLGESMFN